MAYEQETNNTDSHTNNEHRFLGSAKPTSTGGAKNPLNNREERDYNHSISITNFGVAKPCSIKNSL